MSNDILFDFRSIVFLFFLIYFQRSLLRQSAIRILSHLVSVLGARSVALHGFAIPVLEYGTQSDEQARDGEDRDVFVDDV